MNSSTSLNSLLLSLWWLWILVVVIFFYKLFKATIKGILGELVVSFFLSRLDKKKYRVINDLLLEVGGRTCQIDHVVVSNFGIFVIETKNYSGWIFGDESSLNWTQVIYKNKQKFYNPLKQNQGHITTLQKILPGYPSTYYVSLVVFSLNANFKFTYPLQGVIHSVNLLREIKEYSIELISDADCDRIYSILRSSNITDKGAMRRHIQSIRNNTNRL